MSGLGRMAVTPVITSGGFRTFKHDAVTCGMSVIEFLGPGEKEPRGRLGRRSRKRERLRDPILDLRLRRFEDVAIRCVPNGDLRC